MVNRKVARRANIPPKNREHRHVLATVAKKGETNEQMMVFIMDKTLEQLLLTKTVYIVLMELHHHTT